jgi:hypothetical protein
MTMAIFRGHSVCVVIAIVQHVRSFAALDCRRRDTQRYSKATRDHDKPLKMTSHAEVSFRSEDTYTKVVKGRLRATPRESILSAKAC